MSLSFSQKSLEPSQVAMRMFTMHINACDAERNWPKWAWRKEPF